MTSQAATVARSTGNTVIQIVGDGNRVEAGHPHLTLTRFTALRQIRQDFDRLSPYSRSVPLVGREAQLASLQAFLNLPDTVRARVVTGGGGSGKTRLALELCEQSAEAGWDAGFATGREMKRFLALQNLSSWGWQRPTLIVIDDAAQHVETLGDWIAELADREALVTSPSLRILLLEREAHTDSGWWPQVFERGGYQAFSRQALLDPPQPWPVPPLEGIESRLKLLKSLLGSMSAEGALVEWADDLEVRQRLISVDWRGDPFTLLMAGLTMVEHRHPHAFVPRRIELARKSADLEAERLRALAKVAGVDEVLALHLAAGITLAQGTTRDQFLPYAEAERHAIYRVGGGDAANIADMLSSALPYAEGGMAVVRADLIGEAFVLKYFDAAGSKAVLRCYENFGDRIVESLVRIVQDYGDKEQTPLHWLNALVNAAFDDPIRLAAIDIRLSQSSTVLREVNLRVAQRLIELDNSAVSVEPALHAGHLIALTAAQLKNGLLEPALQAAKQATRLYRGLVEVHRDEFQPHLAGSLHDLGVMLTKLGHRDQGLGVAQESIQLYRQLADARPDMFKPFVAKALSNVSAMLSELDRKRLAIVAADEAVTLWRELAERRPDIFRCELAKSLNNQAAIFGRIGDYEEALRAVHESVGLRRGLAAAQPDRFKPELAESLNNLANALKDLHLDVDALNAAREAKDMYQEFSTVLPEVFLPKFARSLMVLALRTEAVTPSPMGSLAAYKLAHESLTVLKPALIQRPSVHRDLMLELLNDYLRLCETTNTPPDTQLIDALAPTYSSTWSDT